MRNGSPAILIEVIRSDTLGRRIVAERKRESDGRLRWFWKSAIKWGSVRRALIDRPEDLSLHPFTTRGFLLFSERLRGGFLTNSTGNDFAEPQTLIESRA